ncbi:hydrogen peroxide-inducible protein [Thermobispora bispora]|uniref:Probable hydrogen peroxide-inducible genes activator n=1 Tax=Thermobispora bispora (strain ATCC 19993 / DSM 43833 / CBS 139.67 / JCM 10125 / KCTC 9307 / NBRC 14880 / R51) TaxID=469371 RepID=D6Y352_THEBD|nr:LysR substrate-binding domain-containing protein [Thermobispora bispora]ADG88927.1 transcriptional regulator, LysR family [Thermobispora bispora DSM 43833]MBO2473495.1 DNA-binding transcriptional regulator OxyR [Actinomycetales bacterium]MBX6167814.1 LysR family transcriptional regulator [Thermobispora bispora]MDI9579899.1 LysR substrate-binding domain-containing protein [Thermobispora sp.]
MIAISEPLPTIAQLRAFLAVADHLHFRDAAAALRMSQPALSSAIAALERTLQTQLLERTTRKVMLTPAGERVSVHAARILADLENLVADVARSREPFTGPAHLGVIPTVAPYLLPTLLPMFAERFPGLRLIVQEAKTETLLEEVREGGLDLALVALPTEVRGLVEEPLYDEDFLLALPCDHPLAQGTEPLGRDVLKGLDIVLLNQGHCLREQAIDVCREVGARATMTTYATSLQTLIQLVAGGLGVTLVPRLAVADTANRPDRLALRHFAEPPGRRIGLVYRATSARSGEYAQVAAAIRGAIEAKGLPVRVVRPAAEDGAPPRR